jgi:hypothetical protein
MAANPSSPGTDDRTLPEITDEQMREGLAASRGYAVAILRRGACYGAENAPQLIWEHGRRNFALRAAGSLAIVCPVMDESDLCGVGLFATTVEETERLLAGDPAVQAGVFTVEVHPCRSFPGDALP